MTSPTWAAATPGQATLSGQVNQFLSTHTASFIYQGTAINSVTAGSSSDALGANGQLAFRFSSGSVASALNLSRVSLALGATNAGCDVYMTLQGDTGGGPDGNILASCYIPAEWLLSGQQSSIPSYGFPLVYSMSSLSYYNIVLSPVPTATSLASGVNDVVLTRSTATTGAYVYNGISWAAKSYGYSIQLYSTLQSATTASTQNLTNVYEDNGALHKRYQYNGSNLISVAQEWAAKYATAPLNILCRDDASFESSIGTFTATNASIATSTTYAYDGTHSARLTVTGTPSSTSMATTTYNPTNGVQYILATPGVNYSAVAYVAPSSTLRNIRIDIKWYTGNATPVFISTSQGTAVAQTAAGTFTPTYLVSATAPANTVLAQVVVTILPSSGTLSTGEIHYIDAIGVFENANTVWSYPGLGISSTKTLSYNSANSPSSAA